MKQFFTFKTFANGHSDDPLKWQTHGHYSAGLDIVGIPEIGNVRTQARPNTIQLTQDVEIDTVSSSGSGFTGLPEWIRYYNGIANFNKYAFETGTSAGRIYKYDSSNSWWVSAKNTSAVNGGGGLEVFNNSLYFGQDTVLGRLSSDGTYLLSAATFTGAGSTPRPMKIFAGKLHIGNDNYISTVDALGVFTAAGLTLPVKYVVRSIETLGDWLWIAADNGVESRIFLWDGTAATYADTYTLPETVAPLLIQNNGEVFALGRQIYKLQEAGVTQIFPSIFSQAEQTPASPTLGGTAIWKNQVLFGIGQTGTSIDADGNNLGGVWMMGQYKSDYPKSLSLHFIVPPYTTDRVDVGGIWSDGGANVSVAYNNVSASSYGIASFQNNPEKLSSTMSYYETLPMDFSSGFKKLFHAIKCTVTGDQAAATPTISVYYRTDIDVNQTGANIPAWNLLKTIGGTTNADQDFTIPIRKIGRNIQFKFLFTARAGGGADTTDQLVDFTVVYEPLDEYR